jgi:hypothetical protein
MVVEVLTAPATYGALLVVALGAACWWKRDALSGVLSGHAYHCAGSGPQFDDGAKLLGDGALDRGP